MPLLSAEALAGTYNPSADRNGWEQVQLYRQTQRYPDDRGGARIASAINVDDEQPSAELTRSNVRAWANGDGMPNATPIMEVADDLIWFAYEWTLTVQTPVLA